MLGAFLRRRRWSLLGWLASALFLAGTGVALYYGLPPKPRWTLDDDARSLIAEDGEILATCKLREGEWCGPVQIWDTATGQEVARFLNEGERIFAHGQTSDGRHLVAIVPAGRHGLRRITSIDLNEQKSRHADSALGEIESSLFSANCNVVAVRVSTGNDGEAAYTIADTAAGRVLDRFTIALDARDPKDGNLQNWELTPANGIFSGDGRYFIVNLADGDTFAMRIVDTRTGKATVVEEARLRAIATDSPALIAQRGDGPPWIWDLAAMDWRAPLEADAPDTLRFSGDGRWVASVPPKEKMPVPIRFFDLRTGRMHWELHSITQNNEEIQEEQFSANGRLFVLPTEPAPGQRRLAVYDVERKELLWERTSFANFGTAFFAPDSSLLINGLPSGVEVAEAHSGEVRYTIELPKSVGVDPALSRDGRTLYVVRQPDMPQPMLWTQFLEEYWPWPQEPSAEGMPLYAYDLSTGRELWRTDTPPAEQLWFNDDCVVTRRPDRDGPNAVRPWPTVTTIECWDTPPRKRLGWIIGVPTCLGAMLLLLRAVWRRVRRLSMPRPAPAAPPNLAARG
jgi:hypothetical protein